MKPRLLFISHVNPANPRSGQQQRVFYSLKAARAYFYVTFLTLESDDKEDAQCLHELADEVIFLPRLFNKRTAKIRYLLSYLLFTLKTGLKTSNFVLGEIEFSPKRLMFVLENRKFDGVIFEYWYAYKSAASFRQHGIPCILDTHDILWKAFEQQVKVKPVPVFYKRRIRNLYKHQEQNAWKAFDRIITLNQLEQENIKAVVGENIPVDFLPMGIDLNQWKYLWKRKNPVSPQICFYGGLSSEANVKSALWCLDKIMPFVWLKLPSAEFWLIGNRPVNILLQRAEKDSRIKITGFVQDVAQVIAEMGVILCPWEGVFGFRSRIIEVMAVGVPLVVSEDAIAGMGIAEHAIKIGRTDAEIANNALEILENENMAQQMSLLARQDVEKKYSFESTYLDYFENLAKSLEVG